MVKRPLVNVRQAPLAILALLLSPNCLADWRFTPTVDLKETYTDNVNQAPPASARARFVSEVAPGFLLFNNAPRLKLRALYQLSYFPFSDGDIANTNRSSSRLTASMNANVIDELMYLDAVAGISQQAISAFGPLLTDNFSNANRAEVRTYRISPSLRHRFGRAAIAELRYARDSVDAGNSGLGTSDGNTVALNLHNGPGLSTLGWGANLSRQVIDFSRAPTSTVENADFNLRYSLTRSFRLTGRAGYDKFDYQSLGGTTQGKSWSGGFEWTPSLRTSLRASAGRRYYGSSYALSANHRSRHTIWSINYNDAVTTTRDQFLLPATIDTAALLDRLFSAQIADPVAREAAVAAYIRATGLPAALADNINYFSNRFILQKQLQASGGFNTARTTSVLSVFDTRREALSTVQTDSALLGSTSVNLNDNTSQRGASALLNMRLSPLSNLNLSLTSIHVRSNSTSDTADHKTVRLGLTHQFRPKLHGAVEVRHTTGATLGSTAGYRENAVTASLSMQL